MNDLAAIGFFFACLIATLGPLRLCECRAHPNHASTHAPNRPSAFAEGVTPMTTPQDWIYLLAALVAAALLLYLLAALLKPEWFQ